MKIVVKIFSLLKPVTTPIFGFLFACTLLISTQAFADTSNFFTGCIKNSGQHTIYNAQLGISPSTPCNGGDTQVSADYGDITSITAGTGLTGGATQGAATISIANGGVSTAQLAAAAVTVAKINSESATNGQVLTANGSGGATWQNASGSSTGLPFICIGCELWPYPDKFAGKDFSNAQLELSDASNINISGVIFTGGILTEVNFENSNLTSADLSNLIVRTGQGRPGDAFGGLGIVFHGANLTNTNFSNDALYTSDFRNANLQNTNFTNANVDSVNFTGATNMSTANITGVTWSNTTCPDGTNSNSNGNACVGHF